MAQNELAFAVRDQYAVSDGHSLIIPRRHVRNWWEATAAEHAAMLELLDQVKAAIDVECRPDGYNIGVNNGEAAGQTVFHLHMHLIPRYDGDVADPRGGVRHVLPSRARAMVEISEPEQRLQEMVAGGELVRHALALLDEGRRSATYKPALLLALVELALERADGADVLSLSLADIADRVMELYWQQTRPHPDSAAGVLRQVRSAGSGITGAILQLRAASGCAVNASLGQVRLTHPDAYEHCRKAVARTLAMQPIPRLQRPGPGGQYPRFLYDDGGFIAQAGWRGHGEPRVVLRPGVAQALAAGAPVLRRAVEDVWTREVVSINALQTQEEMLRSFLFGADRAQLAPVADALRDIGHNRCFWCDATLTKAHVDHVIPWSHHPSDDLFNLVLADPVCNSDKRDRLVAADRIEQWTRRDLGELAQIATDLRWPLDTQRSARVALSAYRHLPFGIPVWEGRKALQPFDEQQRMDVQRSLGSLIA